MLYFDIDESQLNAVTAELGLTEKQIQFAFDRALKRTAATLRKLSEKGLKSELEIKKMSYLRRRLKTLKMRKSGAGSEIKLWYGLNDMPVSTLKGSMSKTTSGAAFSGKAGSKDFKGGFIGNSKFWKSKTIFARKGKARLPLTEAELPVKDKMEVFVEDKIFTEVDAIFWKHFIRDVTARAKFGVGATNYIQFTP